jgi:hypothetical protein
MNARRITIGVILIPTAVAIYFTMEKASVKYFGGITLGIIAIFVLFSGIKKKNYADSAPPEPMAPDEHTPGFISGQTNERTNDRDEHSI